MKKQRFLNIKLTLLALIICLLTLSQQPAIAGTNTCTTKNGPPEPAHANFGSKDITDPSQDVVGSIFPSFADWDLGISVPLTCDCDAAHPLTTRYYSATSPLPVASVDGDKTFFKINDYISSAIKIYIGGNQTSYTYVPFTNIGDGVNVYSYDCGPGSSGTASTGSKGAIDIKIEKAIVGSAFFNNIHVADVYVNKSTKAPLQTPYLNVFLSGSINVPLSCTINAGAQLTIDLGQFYTGDFKTAGQKPDNYTSRPFIVPIKCNDSSASANMTLRIQGTPSTGFSDALQSDNATVGVVITDSNGDTLRPNDTTSVIPITLDSSNEANITLHAYPVSTTGNTPVEGMFTTLAYLRLDFA